MPYGTFTILDYSEEKSVHRIYNGEITAASLPGYLTDFGNYRTALEGIILGTVHKETWVGDDTVLSNSPPANAFAQREIKLLVRYLGDTNNDVYTMEIPTPDLSSLTLLPQDFVDLNDGGIMAAWVGAFEQIARTPDDVTETCTVLSAKVVGRNI